MNSKVDLLVLIVRPGVGEPVVLDLLHEGRREVLAGLGLTLVASLALRGVRLKRECQARKTGTKKSEKMVESVKGMFFIHFPVIWSRLSAIFWSFHFLERKCVSACGVRVAGGSVQRATYLSCVSFRNFSSFAFIRRMRSASVCCS